MACTYGLGGLDGEAPSERGEPAEETLLLVAQELVAPFDRRAQRSLAFRRAVRPRGKQREALLEPFEQLVRVEHGDARRGELDRKREPVEAPTDLRHSGLRSEPRV